MKNKIFKIFKKKPGLTYSVISIVLVSALFIVLLCTDVLKPLKDKETNADITQDTDDNQYINPEKLKIIPLVSDSAGISESSGFKILSDIEYADEDIERALSVTPEQSFKIKAISNNEFLLNFDENLKSNSIYKFAVEGEDNTKRSWAFQTKKTFSVVRSLPRNEGTYVPLNSGIEMTFSHDTSEIENIEDFFEIQPAVKGRFEYHKKTLVFVPEKLEPDTIYTVNIKKGLNLKGSDQKLNEDYVFKFQTQLSQDINNNIYFSYASQLYDFTTDTAPVLDVYTNDKLKDSGLIIEVYKYNKMDSFIKNIKNFDQLPSWARYDGVSLNFEMTDTAMIASFETQIIQNNNGYWYKNLIAFPEPLSEGYYIIKTTIDDIVRYTHVQINDTAVNITIAKNMTLIWVNDSRTGKPINMAEIELNGLNKKVATDTEGIAVIDGVIPDSGNGSYYHFQINVENRASLIALANKSNYSPYEYYWAYDFNNYYNSDSINNFWRYLYLDRDVYLPNDTVNFWGIIKPRNDSNPPSKVTLELLRYDAYIGNDGMSPVFSKDLELSRLGTFSGQFDLENYSSGSYYVAIKYDDKTIIDRYFQVKEYTKPAYKIDVQPDKDIAYIWEDVNINVQTSFFEGSPLSGLSLNYFYNIDSYSKDGNITSDSNGSSKVKLDLKATSDTWRPHWVYFYVKNAQAEEEEVNGSTDVRIFPSDTMIEIEGKSENNNGIVKVKTSSIDISKFKDNDVISFSDDEYRGRSKDMKLTAVITEKYWDKREIGDYYDFINKQTYKKYEYFEVKNHIKTIDFNTVDGSYEFNFPVEKDKYYVIKVTGYDGKNKKISETGHIYGNSYTYSPYNPNQNAYYFVDEKDKNSYKLGEEVLLSVKRYDESISLKPNEKFLFLPLKNGILDYDISKNLQYSFAFTEEHVPNIYVKAINFDGKHFYDIGFLQIKYDYNEKELKFNITPDKEIYRPGDMVNLKIYTEDTEGNPIAAEVNVSVVDEAYFTLQDQYVTTLGSIYEPSVSPGIISSYTSHNFNEDGLRAGGAEQGEGGDKDATASVYVRSTFKDTSYFNTVKTNTSGNAELSFKLPDNLTSWRVTYQGISDDLKAGSGKINISSKIPFFVDTIFNNTFITGDSPTITLRSFGDSIKKEDVVNYSVKVEGENGYNKVYTAKGPSSSFTGVSLESLTEGSYSITIEGSSGDHSDALKRTFNVVPSLLQASRVNYYTLTDNLKPQGGNSLTTLTFYNKASSAFYQELNNLAWSWGQRVDQELSRIYSRELLEKYFGEENNYVEENNLLKYQLSDGGIALLSYDSSNPELSAKIASLASKRFDKEALKSYFYGILNNKDSVSTDVAASYWGLAALNEPVLIEIQNLLGSEGLVLKEQLYLGIALAELGDFEGAQAIYTNVLRDFGTSDNLYAFISEGTDRDSTIELTSLASIIALNIDASEGNAMFNYIKQNSTSELLVNLERLAFVENNLPDATLTGKFSYELDGEKKEVTLSKSEKYQLTLTAKRLKNIRFYSIEGEIEVASSYVGSVADLIPNSNKLIGLSRVYTLEGNPTDNFKQSDLVKIVITPTFNDNAPDGFYEITDVLPSGFKFASTRQFNGYSNYDRNNVYPDKIDGQKVVFGIYYNKKNPDRIPQLVYYARAISPGKYTSDNAVMKHSLSDITSFTNRKAIEIIK